MIGTTLDKYEVLSKIGEGGMATVYRGRHATLNRDVAIKVLHPHLSSSTRNRKRFAREARAIEKLRHANILEIFDYSGVETGECYIITEFVDGATLTEVMDRCRHMPSEVATLLGIALAEAFDYAHSAGILHRDLKPDNVMIRRDGQVKLMDFGIARFLNESQVTMTGALVGSPAFMSPEQAREDTLDVRSDLFSLGTLLFFLVTGHLPFAGSNPSLILKNIIEGRRPSVAELAPTMSASLADVIERLLAPSREERFQDARSVGAALQACLDEIRFDPTDPRWRLSRFLKECDAYEAELDEYLPDALLAAGRTHLDRGDHLGALRLLNRLLSMREDHPEALELLSNLHGADDLTTSRRWQVVVAACLLASVFGGLAWRLAWSPDPTQIDGATTADGSGAILADAPGLTEPVPAAPPPQGMDAPEAVPAAPDASVDDAIAQAASPSAVEDRLDVVTEPPARAETSPPPRAARTPGTTQDARPPAPEPPADEDAPPAQREPACVALRSYEVADIFLEGKRIRSTRTPGCTELAAGTYTFSLTGPAVKDHTVQLTLEPGAQVNQLVDLERKPVTLRIPRTFAGDCNVIVDGRAAGTTFALSWSVELEAPDTPHDVVLQCTSGTWRQHFEAIDTLTANFAGTEIP